MSCRLCMLCSSMCSSKFSNLSWSHSTIFSVPRCSQWPSISFDIRCPWNSLWPCEAVMLWFAHSPHAVSGPARRTCGGNQGVSFHSARLFTWMLTCRMPLSKIQRSSQVNAFYFILCSVGMLLFLLSYYPFLVVASQSYFLAHLGAVHFCFLRTCLSWYLDMSRLRHVGVSRPSVHSLPLRPQRLWSIVKAFRRPRCCQRRGRDKTYR